MNSTNATNPTGHLTEEQFVELLFAAAAPHAVTATEAHLAHCERCAAEFAGLRESLSLFRTATTNYANEQLRRMPQCTIPARRPLLQPAYFAAAAALVLAAFLPMQILHQRAAHHQPTTAAMATAAPAPARTVESDQALLQDIDNDISASVPAPMEALADPNAGMASATTSSQRKD